MRKIALVNQKGGVSKTTTCINLAAGLAKLKKKVCVIDLDPQSHLTQGFGVDPDTLEFTVFDLFKGDISPEELMIEKQGVGLIPANRTLSGAEQFFGGRPGRDLLLRTRMASLTGADFVLIDCSPNLGFLVQNALAYATEIFVPCQAEFLALQGFSELIETTKWVQESTNPKIKITGIILAMFDKRRRLSKEIEKVVKAQFKKELFRTYIRENVALAECISHGETIFEYAPKSHGAIDYLALAKEIIKRK